MARWAIGREAELAVSSDFLDSLSRGPAALIFEGEAGIGKTTLWQETSQGAAQRSYQVLSCRPVESEVKLFFAGMADLLAGISADTLTQLLPLQRRALDVALLQAEPGEVAMDKRTIFAAFLSVLVLLAKSAPVLLAVDDARWLDGSSANVLEFALRRLRDYSVGVVTSMRVPEETVTPLGLDQAFPDSRLRRVPVGPLSLAALHDVVQERLGHVFPRPTLARIHTASGGNPLFALEIARVLMQTPRPPGPGEALPIPSNLKNLLADRIEALPPTSLDALFVVSAAAQPTVDLVTSVMTDGAKDVAVAEKKGLIETEAGRIRFVHPLIASTVYALTPLDERRRLHEGVARSVTDVEQSARHRALASKHPSVELAAALDEAARLAEARGAPDAAAELAELALRNTPSDQVQDVRSRTIETARLSFSAGDSPRALLLLERMLETCPHGRTRASALLLLGEVRYHGEGFTEGIALLEQALDEAGGDSRLIATIELQLTFAIHLGADLPAAQGHAQSALEHAQSTDDPGLLAEALAVVTMVDFLLGYGMAADNIERALALEDPDRQTPVQFRPSLIYAFLLMWTGDLAEARTRLIGLRDRIVEREEERDLPLIGYWLVVLDCSQGELAAASSHAEECLRSTVQSGDRTMRSMALAAQARVHIHKGMVEVARDEVQEALALLEATGSVLYFVYPLSVLGFLEASVGDAAAVDSALGPFVQVIQSAGLGEPAAAAFLPDEIEALISLGEFDSSRPLIDLLEARGRDLDRPWALATAARCRALLFAADGDIGAALEEVDSALIQHERLDMPLELARTLLACGQIHRRARDRRAAKESFDRSLELFDELQMPLWADKVHLELARIGLRRSSNEQLSATEQRIAELAAKGLTNRQVAEALFVSPKTVESNLSKIYRKLGIHSRAELGAKMSHEHSGAGSSS